MPPTPLSKKIRQKWIEQARIRGLKIKKINVLPTEVEGRIRNVGTQDAVYEINGLVTNVKFADDDWFSIGNRTLENIQLFVFICKQPSVFYCIPVKEMKRLAAIAPHNTSDRRKEFHIFPSSNKYPPHTYYTSRGTESVADYYQGWSAFDALSTPESKDKEKPIDVAKGPEIESITEDMLKAIANDLSISSETRRRAKVELDRAVRDRKFRLAIMAAYGHKCAVCGRQLDMVQGAHILPVKGNGSDKITNGIALCNNHHLPYDRRIIFIDSDYHIRLNSKKVHELQAQSLVEGLDEFIRQARIGEKISLPANPDYWPSKDYIKEQMRRAELGSI